MHKEKHRKNKHKEKTIRSTERKIRKKTQNAKQKITLLNLDLIQLMEINFSPARKERERDRPEPLRNNGIKLKKQEII